MKEKVCKNCFYLTSKESKDFPLSDYNIDYGCKFHKLSNGEVNRPGEQRCDDWASIESGFRNLKLEELGIK